MTAALSPKDAPGLSLQERFAPDCICWGCGPANPEGLHLKTFEDGDELVAEWTPGPNHKSFPGVLNGGIIGTLLDCHSNWCAWHHLRQTRPAAEPRVTMTAEYTVRLTAPTPTDAPVQLRARVIEAEGRKVRVEAELSSGGQVTATCSGVFISVPPGHPADVAR